MNKDIVAIPRRIFQNIPSLEILKNKALVTLSASKHFFKLNYNKIFFVCLFVFTWLSVLNFFRSNQHSTNAYNLSSIIQFVFEIVVISILFFSWLCKFKEGNNKIIETDGTNALLEIKSGVPIQQNPITTENKQVFDFSFLLNTKENSVNKYSRLLNSLATLFNAGSGIIYTKTTTDSYIPSVTYALATDTVIESFHTGDCLPGQAVLNKDPMVVTQLPSKVNVIESGLGKSSPICLLFIPILMNNITVALVELSSFSIPNRKDINEVCENITYLLESNNVSFVL